MKLLPTMPSIYHFHSTDRGRDVQFVSGGPTNDKLEWGWCNLGELMEFLLQHGLKPESTTAQGLIVEFGVLHRQAETGFQGKGRAKIRPRKNLHLAIIHGESTRFLPAIKANQPTFEALDLNCLYVPSGWAEGVVRELRAFGISTKDIRKSLGVR